MFNLRLCNAAIIRYSQLQFRHMYLCGIDYKYFSPHCCKCNSFGCTAAIRWGNACHGPHSDSLVQVASMHSQFNSPRLIKREVGFPNPRRVLIGSNQLWRVNDSPYYREYGTGLNLGTLPMCPNITMQVNGAWIKIKILRFMFKNVFGCPHLGQWPMTYLTCLMTLSDWTMSCQPWPPRDRYGQWARYK